MVRLKGLISVNSEHITKRFNSSMVRLKERCKESNAKPLPFQFLDGAIKSGYAGVNVYGLTAFQFLDGAIKRRLQNSQTTLQNSFNSSMVRLKVPLTSTNSNRIIEFQFLDGAIKSG